MDKPPFWADFRGSRCGPWADGILDGYAVIVQDERIVQVAPVDEVGLAERRVVRLPRRLVMPGMVDVHHHLTQSFGKSLVFGEPSEIFRRVWVPMERFLDEEALYLAAKLGALESLRGGFTTVADAGTRAEVAVSGLSQATTEAGLRVVLGYICNNLVDGREVEPRGDVLARAQAFLARFEGTPLVHPSLAVSIPESADGQVLADLSHLSREAGVTFQTHVNEHLVAVERTLDQHGMRPLEYLHHVGALGPQLLAAHATLVTPSELMLLRDTGSAVAYNPVASAWKGNAVAPALSMHELGIRFGLGTDGTRADAFRLLDAAETAQRLVFGNAVGDASVGGGWTWIEHAFAGGADAVGLGSLVGRIAPGYAGYSVVLVPPTETSNNPFGHLDVDGAILVEPEADDRLVRELRLRHLPYVAIGRQPDSAAPHVDMRAGQGPSRSWPTCASRAPGTSVCSSAPTSATPTSTPSPPTRTSAGEPGRRARSRARTRRSENRPGMTRPCASWRALPGWTRSSSSSTPSRPDPCGPCRSLAGGCPRMSSSRPATTACAPSCPGHR